MSRRRAAVAGLLVALLALAGCTGGGKATPAPTPSTGNEVGPGTPIALGQAFGTKWDTARGASYEPYLKKLAGGLTFTEVVWCTIQPQPGAAFDWSAVDTAVQQSRQAGMQMAMKLRTGTCASTGGTAQHARGNDKTESTMPQDLSAYRAFVHAAVARYAPQGVQEYAVENEVNSAQMWSGTVQQYESLTETASKEIRSTDPHALVVDAGISSTAYGLGIAQRLLAAGQGTQAVAAYERYYAHRIGTRGKQIPDVRSVSDLRTQLASAQSKTNLSYLAAVDELATKKVVDVRQVHYYEPSAAVPDLVAYLQASTPHGVPIEAWEVGSFWPGQTDDATQATELTRTVSLLLAGGVRRVIWLPTAYNPQGRHDEEQRYGLLSPTGSVRQSGDALVAVAGAAKDATATPVSVGQTTGVAFSLNSSTTFLLWRNGSGSTTVSVPKTAKARASASAGSIAVHDGGVSVSSAPVLIDVPLPLKQATAQVR